ncbi:hypothetical protein GCM10023149_13140 [Mucilaginibacter gynuensis]|uniref:YtxH-like protein n=1 Tax=Mucilaginibacter gynuensis TaxID=1302236 RepID=A0ABP8G3R1_9SPHI
MGLLRSIAIGAAVAYGVSYITKKRADGTSLADELVDKAPEWFGKAKKYGEEALETVKERVKS